MTDKPTPQPGSFWLVIYECRYNVVAVSPLGKGFFAPGQEPCWAMDNAEWIAEIRPEELDPSFADELERVNLEVARIAEEEKERGEGL